MLIKLLIMLDTHLKGKRRKLIKKLISDGSSKCRTLAIIGRNFNLK